LPDAQTSLRRQRALLVERLLAKRLVDIREVTTGYSATERWLVRTEASTRHFVKIGSTPPSVRALRQEASVYERLSLPCMPKVVAWLDDDAIPILVLEDLSDYQWPPPWSNSTIRMALDTIDGVHSSSAALLPYEQRNETEWDWWRAVEREPEPFLGLRLTTSRWLRSSLPRLIECANAVTPTGNAVTHFDLRADNFCFSASEARLVDWSLACLGNPKLDLGLFLPGLAADGGPSPEEILPREPEIAAWVAGFFAWHASKPFIPSAPRVRLMQRKLLERALPWAIRELQLEAAS
jgi:hypothetical protein